MCNALLLFYGAYLPYHRGKWIVVERLINLFGLQKFFASRAFLVKRRRVRWVLEPECLIQRSIYYCDWYEIHDTKCLLRLVRPDWVFLDIGANIGYYSMLVARAEPRARIYAFEALTESFTALECNRDLNGFTSVHTSCLAISDHAGESAFLIPPPTNRGIGRLQPSDGSVHELRRVPTATVDQFVHEQQLSHVSCMKIDVEGAEELVLSGAADTIRRWRPILMIELNPSALAEFGVTAESLVRRLRSFGYGIYRTKGDRLQAFNETHAVQTYLNLFCLPSPRPDA
jgi:FkbM family methyltransferase